MSNVLQEMIDHHEIRKVLSAYCAACDRCDQPAMAAVYADESWDDHGPRSGRGADFAKVITDEMRHVNSLSHLLGQSTISVTGDEAGAETYFLAVMRVNADQGGEVINQLGGRFIDTLVREEGAWKIRHRVAVRDWSITLPVDQDYIGAQGLKPGKRAEDIRFAALRTAHSGVPDFTKP
ncbi:nuclear transport factor 2 family protein [Novosphingobium sp. M1R2S20]|uniref:Nuclear transport factor 2 family protein n=1 Tax=Novosphingobium rhizovicinum TaxID=3228928 RepID=A0ABV3RE10_9SPHN